MKRLGYTILMLLMTISVVAQNSKKSPTMRFDGSQWDFGTIKEADGPVDHTFTFHNTGTTPFVIEAISVSCGCTTPEYSRAPIMPGKSGEVKITFDPAQRPGKFVKEIYVVSNNRQNVSELKIRGNVVAKPRRLEDDYPMALTSGVRLSGQMANFGYLPQGTSRSQVIGLANTSSRSVTVALRPENQSPYFTVSVPDKICGGCVADITFTYDLTQGRYWGYMNDRTYIYINGKRMDLPLASTAIGTDNFSGVDKASAPVFLISKVSNSFGTVKVGARINYDFTITNDGASTLIIRSAKPSQGAATTLKEGVEIEPNDSRSFTLSFTASQLGRNTASLVVVANDPTRAMRELRLSANAE